MWDKRSVVFFVTFVFIATTFCVGADPAWSDARLHYQFDVPDDWIQIPADAIAEMCTRSSELSGAPKQHYEAAFQLQSEQYFTYPYLLVQHHDLDSATIAQIANSIEELDEGDRVKELKALDWFSNMEIGEPVVDQNRKAIMFRIVNDYPGIGIITALSVALPGRDGMVGLYFYSPSTDFDRFLPVFESILDSFSFDPGHEYSWVQATSKGYSPLISNTVERALIGAVVGGMIGAVFALIRRRKSKNSSGSGQ